MQMNIRGLGLLPFLPLASLMCGVVTAAPPGLEHPFQSVDVPPSNVGTTDNTALPSLAVVEARYSAALQRVEAETPESQLLTDGQFFDYIMKPFHTVHSEIGRGNVVLGESNLIVYFGWLNKRDEEMKGQPGHEMPIHYQYFSEYRFWLKRLSDITRAPLTPAQSI
ncbi:hypothetical protein CXG81DRAFT_21387 [Caulochytrium protostelioides]|uniref:Uncharacterized protein n=1 Tax=Caulochytrium protostelioides TaxID=1555241 RepID=A0A4P9X0Y0_9FUNG|nr:hypothetical protein CXG81DRAFT_21387 [Caulochytrium protostelioides]|eukprot:RKO98368.1 hypothetical protein CXG81DRAFT_21387 [Caulochytrium protostelioides]